MKVQIKSVDEKIWNEEIQNLLPSRIFDFHLHTFTSKSFSGGTPDSLKIFGNCSAGAIIEKLIHLFHQKTTEFLFTGWPTSSSLLLQQNQYLAKAAEKYNFYFLALVSHKLDEKYLENLLKSEKRCLGFKPYKCFSVRVDPEDAKISDFLPEKQIEIANQYGLVITLHLSKKKGICDPENIEQLLYFVEKYPHVIWNLAHCGRSYIPHNLEKSINSLSRLKGKKQVFFDTSAVTDREVFVILFSEFGANQILFGSDAPVCFYRGRCVRFGYDWAFITQETHSITASFPVSPALLLYEQLWAMCHAIKVN
ncbi:MAG TPA: amidohydrolase family protein, partial [bacterium]|nr:amidohydrolase family protein [bacterium]